MEKEIRVLHVLSSLVYRGAENVACQIIHMFGENENVTMFYASPDGEVRPSLIEQGVDYHPLKKMCASEVARVIREVKPNIVHAHDMRASFYAALVCGKIPLVSHIHINNIDSRTITPKALAYTVAANKAKRIFWVSQSAYDGYHFRNRYAGKSLVLQNVIDPDMLREKAGRAELQAQYDIVYIGAIESQKNPERLGKVFSQVLRSRPRTKIAVVGKGTQEDVLKTSLQDEGMLEKVDMLGFQRNPYGILSRAGLMLMTSDYEGTPMSALEALTLGIPMVSTPVDGMCDLVEDGSNGFLAEGVENLAAACCRILDDAQLHEKMSEAAKAKAAEILDVPGYKKVLSETYENCLK